MKPTMQDVYQFWQNNLCMDSYLKSPYLSREYFSEGYALRYKYHYHIPEAIERLARLKPGGKVLEIGVGMGIDTQLLCQRGFEVAGIDLTDKSIEATRSRLNFFHLPADIRIGNAEGLDFPDEAFDVVYSFGVLHHTPDTARAIAEVHRVLKKGGIALIMLYHRDSLNYWAHQITFTQFDGTLRDRCPVERAYSVSEIRGLFRTFGKIDIGKDYLFGTGWKWVNHFVPLNFKKKLGKTMGWHLMIWVTK